MEVNASSPQAQVNAGVDNATFLHYINGVNQKIHSSHFILALQCENVVFLKQMQHSAHQNTHTHTHGQEKYYWRLEHEAICSPPWATKKKKTVKKEKKDL